jgi:serine/threonine protein kinase/tetratricopeptide (TPR) repeat protein
VGPAEVETIAHDRERAATLPATIGPYRVLELLGEGGMGVVYLAEQTSPIRRRVALKIIKLGMDTREVVGRFEAERQALALMDHPNIASVYDAGATAEGRPYFAMEYVAGVPITEYCDGVRLPTRARLELFVTVCQALQHAHQKGIIHRDVKSSNVLVAVHDGRPVAKVIDFGVAKATQPRLTEQSMFTEHGVLIGTPEYMSPEQASLSGIDIDATTDIYSLGVLLYELLVGALPFDSATLRRAGFAEIQRVIREDEPPRPSTKLDALDHALSVAAQRRTDLSALRRELLGDLDWITLRAMDKDRTRRYASASEFAADIGRHLTSEPVAARPPSARYRAGKFVARHRAGVAAALVSAAAVVTALILVTTMYVRARDEAARSRLEVEAFNAYVADADTDERMGRFLPAARRVLDAHRDYLADRPVEYIPHLFRFLSYSGLGSGLLRSNDIVEWSDVKQDEVLAFDMEIEKELIDAMSRAIAAGDVRVLPLVALNGFDQAEFRPHGQVSVQLLRDAARFAGRTLPAADRTRLGIEANLARTLEDRADEFIEAGKPAEAVPILQEALVLRRAMPDDAEAVVTAQADLVDALLSTSRAAEAEVVARDAIRVAASDAGTRTDRVLVADLHRGLGAALTAQRRFDDAEHALADSHRMLEALVREAIDERLSSVDKRRAALARTRQALAGLHEAAGRSDRAAAFRERWIDSPAELRAAELLRTLRGTLRVSADILQAVERNRSLPDDVRQAALRRVRLLKDDWGALVSAARDTLLRPGASAEQYRRAWRWAGVALDLNPGNGECLAVLALAQHRTGRHQEALDTAARAKRSEVAFQSDFASAVAVLARIKIGQIDAVRPEIARLLALEGLSANSDLGTLVGEVQAATERTQRRRP